MNRKQVEQLGFPTNASAIIIDCGFQPEENVAWIARYTADLYSRDKILCLIPSNQIHLTSTMYADLGGCLTKAPAPSELRSCTTRMLAKAQEGNKNVYAEPTKDREQLSILVVDDSMVNQEVAIGLLEIFGHRALGAASGYEALQLIAQERFDMVFMDLEMPEMDGLEATRQIRIRELTTGQRTPIVAMTAHAIDGVLEKCSRAGMDSCATKPIQPEQLQALIEQFAT